MPSLYRILEMILYSLLNFLPYMFLAMYPFRKKFRFPMPVIYIFIGIVTSIQVAYGIWAGLFATGNVAYLSALSTLTYLLFYFLTVKVHFGKTLFTLLMLSNIANFDIMVSKCLEGQLFPELSLQSYRWSFSLIFFFVELLTLIPLFFYIKKTYCIAFEMDSSKSTWRFLWLIPATFYLVWYHRLYNSNMSSLEIALQPSNSIFLLLINMSALLIYHIVIRLIKVTKENMELNEKNHILALQNVQYLNLQDKIHEARRAKHDMRHHISLMKSYLKEHEYDKLETYLNSYQKTLPDDSVIVFCDNRAINVLLLYFAQQAKNHAIDYEVHTQIPETLKISEIDLSVLLGNVLENALRACSMQKTGEKQMIIKAKADSCSIFFAIDNTYDSAIRQNKQGKYLSTQETGTGLGLTSVRSIVEKYNGSLNINHDNGVFRVSIMLNIPSYE